MTRHLGGTLLAASLPLLAGCYESATPLGSLERGTIDATLIGTWQCNDPANAANVATLVVMPFDQRQYYLEWREDDKVSRYGAYSSRVREETLFNVRELKPTSGEARWIFLRALRKGNQLELAVVKEDSLEDLHESAALKAIERRIKDEALYGLWAQCAKV